MSENVEIRPAQPADRPIVLQFHRELYIHHRDEITRPEVLPLFAYRDMEGTLRDDVQGLLRGGAIVLIAERHAVPVGYITGHIEMDPRRVLSRKGVIEDWYVVREERGRGTGRLLMAQIEQLFREQACEALESGTWAFNDAARLAHAKAGFTEIEVRFRKKLD